MDWNSAAGSFATRWQRATKTRWRACCLALATALALASAGCRAPQVTYLHANERTVHLKAGESAPYEGWLLSDDRLAEIYDLLDARAPETAETPR